MQDTAVEIVDRIVDHVGPFVVEPVESLPRTGRTVIRWRTPSAVAFAFRSHTYVPVLSVQLVFDEALSTPPHPEHPLATMQAI